MTRKEYRHFKSTGLAHTFQQLITKNLYDSLDFNTIPGKALTNMVSKNFLEKHEIDKKYFEWLKSQPLVKYTGYVYELASKVKGLSSLKPYQTYTFDKQFDTLLSLNKGGITEDGVWCALDTSGSMTSKVCGNITAYDICVSLGIYFSSLNKGAFNKNVIMFDDVSRVKQLRGNFCDMLAQIHTATTAWGSTNFQSVIDEIIRIRTSKPNIPLEDYPKTLIVVSDMQFNSCGHSTNAEKTINKLSSVFPTEWVSKFKVIWWNVNSNRKSNFPSTIDNGGMYNISGFDGSVISLLLGEDAKKKKDTPISMEELVQSALSQEILEQIKL